MQYKGQITSFCLKKNALFFIFFSFILLKIIITSSKIFDKRNKCGGRRKIKLKFLKIIL